MQINSIHVPDLAAHYGLPEATVQERLRDDVCFNTRIAAWLLKREIALADGDFWQGVGRYHSRTPSLRDRYIRKVVQALRERFGTAVFMARVSQ
jgi:hypothetical protein